MTQIVDPRLGDVEDDACSTKSHSLLSLAGSLLAEISLPKLIVSWLILLILPGILLGIAPLAVTAWIAAVAGKILSPIVESVPILIFAVVVALGWLFWRRLFQLAESSFWSLNALVIEPSYTMCRELLRHLMERRLPEDSSTEKRERMRTVAAAASGILVSGLAILVLVLLWPYTRWIGDIADFLLPQRMAWVALANAVALVCAYFAAAALVWAFADVTMPQPRDLESYALRSPGARTWRVAHLSDLHVVGERYGYRIECGRSGPRGNARVHRVLTLVGELDTSERLDAILITGDATDAGRSSEWAEFLDALAAHPQIADRVLLLPGNHDVSIVDRANPARLDLPIGPKSRLRKLRTLSAINMLQGTRVHVVDHAARRVGKRLTEALQPHVADLTAFANAGRPLFSTAVTDLWASVFPMVLPPDREDGLGIVLLESNADAHFSFTNALGMMSANQVKSIDIVTAQFPQAGWLIALHHHVVEYPQAAIVLSERIGTALINGNWFVRSLLRLAKRAVVMHGHRHIDWIGQCGGLPIISAPSPVMGATNGRDTYFYVHTLQVDGDGHLTLLPPQRIVVRGERESDQAQDENGTGPANGSTPRNSERAQDPPNAAARSQP